VAKHKYEYECPHCSTRLDLRMRVTQTKRKCPQCGTAITTNEIDRQTVERAKVQMAVGIGCVGLLVLMYVGMRVLLWVRGE
jgi:uncharacterized protein (DUF983 family)